MLLESGSFLTVGGAVIDTYNMYKGFNKTGRYKAEIFADLSKIDKNVKTVSYQDIFQKKYDLVFLNSIRDVPIAMKYKRKMGRRTKFLYVDRGNVLINFRKAGIKKLLPKMMVRYLYTIYLARLLDYYVAITAEQYEFAKSFFNPRRTKVSYINIAAHKEFRKLNIKKGYSGALYVGRLDERQKKVNFLIRGIAEVVKRYPALKNKELLRIIGEGPDEDNYRQLSSSLGLDKNIRFAGFVREEKLVRAYNDCGFLISTSEWESPGRIFLEAMACGTTLLINTNNNAVMRYDPEEKMVEDGDNGLVYNYGEIGSFAEKFYVLYADKELRERLAKNAYEYIKRYDFSNTLKRYERLIDGS